MEISNIVFYRDNNNRTKTVVLYNDGTIKDFSYSEGIELLLSYAKEKEYTKINELKNDKNLKIWNNRAYKENITKLVNDNRNNNNSNATGTKNNAKNNRKKPGIIGLLSSKIRNIKEKLASKLTRKPKKKKTRIKKLSKPEKNTKLLKNKFNFLKKEKTKKKSKKRKKHALNVLIGTLVAACIGTGAWIKRDITKKQQAFEKEAENDNNINVDNNKNNKNYNNIYKALKADMNIDKSKAINSIWKYISDYNISVSKNHISDNSSTKLGLKWDEVVAKYLAYNDLSQQSINNIFDTYKFDSDVFINAYKSGFDQEVLAHTIQIEPLNKNYLIKNKEGKKLYKKYESIIIGYNGIKGDTKKVEYAKKFYNELRKDFDFNKSNIENVEKYKLSIMPMVKAMDKMTSNLNLNNKLSKPEQEYFNKLSSTSMIKSKFKNIENKLTSYQIASDALDEKSNEISYKKLKKLAIKELKNDNAYKVANNDERNIRDHSEYKKNTSYAVASNDNTQTVTNTSSANSSEVTSTKTKSNNKKGKIKAKKIKDENINDADVTTVENTDDENNKDDDYYYVAPDTNEDTNSEDINNDQENNNVVDDESVKDVTTDSTDAVESDTPLPDPNNEDSIQTTNSSENNDSLITVTYINPKGVSASENYEISNNDQNSNESVATQDTSEEISTDNYVKTYTR